MTAVDKPQAPKIYYISVHLNNNEKQDVLVKWKEVADEKNEIIPSDGALVQEFVIKSNGNPENVTFTAYNPKSHDVIQINGHTNLIVIPTIQKSRVSADIGHIGKGTWFRINFVIINIMLNQMEQILVQCLKTSLESYCNYIIIFFIRLFGRRANHSMIISCIFPEY